MRELNFPGQQRDAAARIAALVAVFKVALDGASYSRELHADLVLAAGEELYLNEVVAVGFGKELVFEARLLGVGARGGVSL